MNAILTQYSFRHDRFWVWIGMCIAIAWVIGMNILVLFTMEIFNRAFPLEACLPVLMQPSCHLSRSRLISQAPNIVSSLSLLYAQALAVERCCHGNTCPAHSARLSICISELTSNDQVLCFYLLVVNLVVTSCLKCSWFFQQPRPGRVEACWTRNAVHQIGSPSAAHAPKFLA